MVELRHLREQWNFCHGWCDDCFQEAALASARFTGRARETREARRLTNGAGS